MKKELVGCFVVCALLTGPSSVAQAQDVPPAPPANPTNANARMVPMPTALGSLTRSTGVFVVANRLLMNSQVPMPSADTTAENLEAAIGAMMKSLPSGTMWAKLYLPLPRSGRFDGDAVADYALAQAKLYGNIGGSTAPGTIEVMGQKVGVEQAATVIQALNLKPVYVLVNSAQAPATDEPATNGNWNNLTPEQRQQYAQQQAQRIMGMDTPSRLQYFQQQAAVMREMMQMMTPEQRAEMMQGMRGGSGGRPGRDGGRP